MGREEGGRGGETGRGGDTGWWWWWWWSGVRLLIQLLQEANMLLAKYSYSQSAATDTCVPVLPCSDMVSQ